MLGKEKVQIHSAVVDYGGELAYINDCYAYSIWIAVYFYYDAGSPFVGILSSVAASF